ncbi:MAG TPA: hypothetical protein VFM32_04135, partial [Spongiibacteraceae bacterium]|nr:hypothetical protein [Spongiibacteraceae bacterium]
MLNSLTIKAKLTVAFSVLTLMVILVSLLSLHEISAGKERFANYVLGTAQRPESASQLLIAAQQREISARNLVSITSPEALKSEHEIVVETNN